MDRHKWKCYISGKHYKQRIQLILRLESVVSTRAFSLFSGKKRKPAWTDRILWRIKPKTAPSEDDDEKASTSTEDVLDEYPLLVTQDKYTSDMSYGVSDHKPVIATFCLEVRSGSLSFFPSVTTIKLRHFSTFSHLLSFPQLSKCFDTPLVHISPLGVWSADQDALLNYTVQEDFMSSTWDWIGLYKVLGQTQRRKKTNKQCQTR